MSVSKLILSSARRNRAFAREREREREERERKRDDRVHHAQLAFR